METETDLHARIKALEAELDRLRKSERNIEDQLVWLADWCRRVLGVDNNSVIGRKDWPHRLVEVVARAVEGELNHLRKESGNLRTIQECAAAFIEEWEKRHGDRRKVADSVERSIAVLHLALLRYTAEKTGSPPPEVQQVLDETKEQS